ncbi:amidohydrolase [Falsibacillus albus]|uniref:Amidohydrolase n=1 Tax=Falsibacillus albus TaxID=2478915 RepID=A0A3L7JZE1_9BACI|nr:amidohydrolase [Falsibacillus albus]RLQ96177.1 amidohydrolase [Falsibacillus albus]
MIIDNVRLYQPFKKKSKDGIFHVKLDEQGYIENLIEGRSPEQNEHVYDAKERVMTASFTDSHLHFLRYGLMKSELDLRHVTSWDEMKREVAEFYPQMEEEDWIVGRGLNDGQFEDIDHLLTGKDLDEIHLDKKMFFLHQDGHECVVNQKVLDLLKEEDDFEGIPDDFKETNDDGQWNGRFKDTAVHYIKRHFRGRSVENAKEAILSGIPHLLRHGITTIHTEDLNFIGSFEKLWNAYTQLEKEERLPIRVYLHHYLFNINDITNYLEHFSLRSGEGTDKVKVGAFKIFLDGTQRLHTSALRMAYRDKPDTAGNLVYTQEELNEMVRLAAENNMQVAMHAIGDRAVEQAIIALEQDEARTSKLHHRIIHAQTLGEDLLKRLEKLKPYIETQPSFLMGEWDKKAKWVGEDLAPYCDAFGSLLRHGIPITLSSDAPIGELNPLEGIFAAVNRTNKDQEPENGWMPQEKLTVDQAFNGYTFVPAEMEFTSKYKGKLEEGFLADFILLDHHPLEVEPKDLRQLRVCETWMNGKRVYSKKEDE